MILDEIVRDKKVRLQEDKARVPLEEMKQLALACRRPTAGFYEAMAKTGLSIIGEFKKASPSLGQIASPISLEERIQAYSQSVDAISCLTEQDHFHGSAEYLKQIREMTELPILRKDFTIDPYQIYEARVIGADAILLIAAILSDTELREYRELAESLQLDALVEVHDETEMQRAIASGARILGVNNRNLKDFTIDLHNTGRLAPMVPQGCLLIAESGILEDGDVAYLKQTGANGFLIGRALMETADPKQKALHWKQVYAQTNRPRRPAIKVCGLTRPEEADMLARCQVDYAGIVLFYPKSKRNISLAQAEEILRRLPAEIAPVAVTVSPTREQLKQLEQLPFRFLQVHGELRPEILEESQLPILRAYNLSGAEITKESHARIAGYVLDAAGCGSGETFDWSQKPELDCEGKLLILAGGLTPENVAEGIRCFCPDVVDVSSGVEGENGKDEEKIRRFAEAVRSI